MIRWYNDSNPVPAYDDNLTVPASATKKGQQWYYQIRVNDGTNNSIWYTSNTETIINTAPTASNVNITRNLQTGDDLVASWVFNDADGDSQNTSWHIWWYKNDVYQGALDGAKTVTAGNTTKGNIWKFILQVYDGTAYSGNYSLTPTVQIQNTPPIILGGSPSLAPATPNTSVDLTASWSFNDTDTSDTESTRWIVRWYKNGVLQSTYDDLKLVPSSATAKAQQWNFTVKVHDGTDYSIQYNSSIVTIINTAPTASDLTVTSNPTTSDVLTASWIATDVDGDDPDSYFTETVVKWYNDTGSSWNLVATTDGNSPTLEAGNTSKGDTWRYTLEVYDGADYSQIYTSINATIMNSRPEVTNPTFNKSSGVTIDDTINITYSYSDPDGDIEISSNRFVYWYRNGDYQAGKTNDTILLTTETFESDFWQYIIKVYDGYNYSMNTTSVIVVIGAGTNNVPTAENLTITANTNTTVEDIVASYDYSDADSHLQSNQTIYWYKDGTLQSAFNDQLTVSATTTSKGEVWNFTVKVFDGLDWSIQYNSSQITILNSVPVASDLTITSTPTTVQNLTTSWTFTDADVSDSQTSYSVTWYIDNVYNSTFDDLTTIPYSWTRKGEIWNYTLTVSDGENTSLQYNSSQTLILNSAPTASLLTLTTNPTTTDNLVANYTFNDVNEGDTEPADSWEIRWYRDNINIPTYNDLKTVPSSATLRDEFWHFTLRVNDSETYSILYQSPQVQILNSIPSLSGFSFNPTIPTRSDNLSVTYAWNDADTPLDSESGTIIRWYREDVLQPTFNDLLLVDSGYIVKGDNWTVGIRVSDGTTFGTWYNTSIIIGNALPEIVTDSAQIFLPPPSGLLYTTSTLVTTWVEADLDGDTISSYEIVWWNTTITPISWNIIPTLANSVQVDPSYTSKKSMWRFRVRIFDGTDWSLWSDYGQATITNSKPIIENITLSGGQTTTDNISLSYDYYDADGDPNNSQIDWAIIHSGIPDYILDGSTILPSENFTAGDLIWVEITPNDGEESGATVQSQKLSGANVIIQVGDTAPEFNVGLGYPIILADHPAGLNGTSNYIATQKIFVNYSVFVEDIDSGESDPVFDINLVDNINIEYVNVSEVSGSQYRWYKYNTSSDKWKLQVELTDSFIDPYYLHKDDQWIVSVRPRDRYGYFGQWENSSSIIIGNSFPMVVGYTWSNLKPTTSDDLEFDFIYQDWDNDPQVESMILVLWFKNGLLISGSENLTILTSDYFIKNDNISVIIRPFDGTNWALYNYTSPVIR
ncbi:MAG: hypothetical protein ACXACK_14640, partial [Candidatus Hodarchaeales archaeon]